MSKPPPPAPTASAIGPCPTVIKIVGRPGTGSLPSTIAPPDHPRQHEEQGLNSVYIRCDILLLIRHIKPNQPCINVASILLQTLTTSRAKWITYACQQNKYDTCRTKRHIRICANSESSCQPAHDQFDRNTVKRIVKLQVNYHLSCYVYLNYALRVKKRKQQFMHTYGPEAKADVPRKIVTESLFA